MGSASLKFQAAVGVGWVHDQPQSSPDPTGRSSGLKWQLYSLLLAQLRVIHTWQQQRFPVAATEVTRTLSSGCSVQNPLCYVSFLRERRWVQDKSYRF